LVLFRKHSSGEQETSTLLSPPLLTAAEDVNQVLRVKMVGKVPKFEF
jgi:hypothetical protein